MTIWLSFCGAMVGLALALALPSLIRGELFKGVFLVLPALMFLFGVGFMKYGDWLARNDYDYIEEQLKEAIGAHVPFP